MESHNIGRQFKAWHCVSNCFSLFFLVKIVPCWFMCLNTTSPGSDTAWEDYQTFHMRNLAGGSALLGRDLGFYKMTLFLYCVLNSVEI